MEASRLIDWLSQIKFTNPRGFLLVLTHVRTSELAVDASIISEHNNELSQRYIDHDVVQRYKSAVLYQEHCTELSFKPIPDNEINALRDSFKRIISSYGENFKNEYGWASQPRFK
jgi:hypothetical protein